MFFQDFDATLDNLKATGEAPNWMTVAGYKTLVGKSTEAGYLLPNETPRAMYARLAKTASSYLNRSELEEQFYDILWRGWLGPASPVISNFGADRGLPISCFGGFVPDDMGGIIEHISEQSTLTWRGGGVASHLSQVRPIGSKIASGGTADGILSPLRMLNATVPTISQNSMRRGSIAAYLKVDHPDIKLFLRMRKPEVDEEQRFLKTHHAVIITDAFADRLIAGDEEAFELWGEILTLRMETGEPYLMFETAANRDNPPAYRRLGLKVNGSNLCCLKGDELVVTKDGNFKVRELVGTKCQVWDGENWTETTFFNAGETNELVRLNFNNGSTLEVTAMHRLPLENGTFVYAWELLPSAPGMPTSNLKNVKLKTHKKRVSNTVVHAELIQFDDAISTYSCEVKSTEMYALANGLMSGNSEIFLATSAELTFVCCLSSLNLARYPEWKDTNLVELAIYFLDAVMSEFIVKAKEMPHLANAVRFAENSRALGLGVLGWHTLLQSLGVDFDSPAAFALNLEIFQKIRMESEDASIKMAHDYGSAEWAVDLGRRHTHLLACAPTLTNSSICGGVSRSIEPIEINAGLVDVAKGTFKHYNPLLIAVLEKYNQNTDLVWRSIAANQGSVQHLNFLSDSERSLFRTAHELDQRVLVQQAIDRGKYIDQGQSLNLFFYPDAEPSYVHEVHWLAYTGGLKSLYYCKTGNQLKAAAIKDYQIKSENTECLVCQG